MILEEVGRGAFGNVSKGIWRGVIVAAKEVPTAGNTRVLANEWLIKGITPHGHEQSP